jgi:hypothetical protein
MRESLGSLQRTFQALEKKHRRISNHWKFAPCGNNELMCDGGRRFFAAA